MSKEDRVNMEERKPRKNEYRDERRMKKRKEGGKEGAKEEGGKYVGWLRFVQKPM